MYTGSLGRPCSHPFITRTVNRNKTKKRTNPFSCSSSILAFAVGTEARSKLHADRLRMVAAVAPSAVFETLTAACMG